MSFLRRSFLCIVPTLSDGEVFRGRRCFLSQDSLSCIHVSKLRYVMVQSLAVFCSWCKSFFQDLAENSLQNVAQEGWSWLLERPKVRVSFARFRWNGAMLQFSAGMVLCRSFGGVSLSKI